MFARGCGASSRGGFKYRNPAVALKSIRFHRNFISSLKGRTEFLKGHVNLKLFCRKLMKSVGGGSQTLRNPSSFLKVVVFECIYYTLK
jgi:hypothetical protein